MNFMVYTPLGTALKTKALKVSFETISGYYTLLPRHVDFVSAMNANIVRYTDEENNERYVACHRGIVVKKGENLTISVQNAVLSDTLDELAKSVVEDFKKNDEERKELNTAMARLELGLMRGFSNLKEANIDGGL